MAEPRGIFQGDLVIQSALRAGFAELRANPWVVDYLVRSLADDPVTSREYGQKQVDEARRWLLATEIPVSVNARLGEFTAPRVTVDLVDSAETDNTLGDVNYEVEERNPAVPWPAVVGPVAPAAWSAPTATVTLPASVTQEVYPGMLVFDAAGNSAPIQSVQSDSQGRAQLVLPPGTTGDYNLLTVRSSLPPAVKLEGAEFRETYLVGAHVPGDPLHLTFLHSAVLLVLLRHRQDLLEARGFQVSSVSSTNFAKRQEFEAENFWSRYVNLVGKCRHVWPKSVVQVVDGVSLGLQVEAPGTMPEDLLPSLWTVSGD